jgi:hypothetical protein
LFERGGTINRDALIPTSLGVVAGLAGLLAALVGQSVWAAILGAAVVLPYWLLERATAAVGRDGPFVRAMAIGLAGMVLRIALVMAVLVTVGVVARGAFLETMLAFVVAFTVYQGLRLALRPVSPAGPRWQQ